jgi:hypothetical protein
MLTSLRRVSADALHISADVLLATLAGGLVLVVFFPITLGAAGVKGVLRTLRPRPTVQDIPEAQHSRRVPQS